jgi:hypothetical protein
MISISCKRDPSTVNIKTKQVKMEVYNEYGGLGFQLKYIINGRKLKIKQMDDFHILHFEKLVYRAQIDEDQYNKFYDFMIRTNFDTLKNSYENPNILDGVFRSVTLKIDNSTKCINLQNYDHPTIDSLLSEIDKLIEKEEYKIL